MPTRANNALEARKRALVKRILESDDKRTIADLEHMVGSGGPLVLSDAQKAELDTALDRYLKGRTRTSSWEEVKARVEAELKRLR